MKWRASWYRQSVACSTRTLPSSLAPAWVLTRVAVTIEWNETCAMPLTHLRTVPILRSFDEAKAREFYIDWLGFSVDWEHRFGSDAPLYMQVSRGGIVFHISEHHGDGSPGVHLRVEVLGVRDYHAELDAKAYKNNRPGIERPEWGGTEFTVIDPVNNRITFAEADQTGED